VQRRARRRRYGGVAVGARTVVLCLTLGVAPAMAAERPVLVELFTSEGCSSCPPADRLLAELASRPDVLALSFHVDYWDRLGWKDPFSSAAATRRQRAYARIFGLPTIYTPQMIVDGRWQAVGSDRPAVARALAAAERTAPSVPLRLTLDRGEAHVVFTAGPPDVSAAVLLIAFDRRHVDRVDGGENDGRLLTHVDVVRGFAEIGRFTGTRDSFIAPVPWPGDRVAAVLEADDGRVIGLAVADRRPAS
jgi:hypothetical protein